MRFLTLLLFSLLFVACARKGTITGGVKDTIPPVMTFSSPKNYTTNFSVSEIKLEFDEYVRVKDASKQLIVSPPMNPAPEITPSNASKKLTIKLKDSLLPNTTYSFNFGNSIQDHNEGNPYHQFTYVFSTGTYIDSLTLGGRIKDAFNPTADNFVSVMLYEYNETFYDSIIYKENPRYITNTLDSATSFRLNNLKEGKYLLVALKDNNNNYKFDPKSDKVAFYPKPISIPDDSSLYELELFREILPFKAVRISQTAESRAYLAFEGNSKDVTVTASDFNKEIPIKITSLEGKDSLQIWFPNIKADSLKITAQKDDYFKEFTLKTKKMKADSLTVTASRSGTLNFRDTLGLKSSTPIEKTDISKISIMKSDSTFVSFNTKYNDQKQEIKFDFEKSPNQKYVLTVLPDAITDIYNKSTDTLTFRFNTRDYTDYGNLTLKLNGLKSYPAIVDLTDVKGKTLASAYIETGNTISFDLLQPELFTIRIIYDENKNGIWDTGNYLEKRMPEEVIYISTPIDVRSNWDVEQTINLGG
ncbi:MAG: Ig-like domain-containing protein [Candidatus Kapabacteria bacterium]|jgi:uncharacterized protein (DUF2141 family)|nr:Ig-like domain-containing protein [Candidatus Kapabacteria bacterium]